MIKIRADELSSKYNTLEFLSLLENEGVLETTWETHDGRMDKVWFYDTSNQKELCDQKGESKLDVDKEHDIRNWPDFMDAYPVEFWEDSKVQEYVKMADEYLKTMRVECENAGDTHEA